MTAFSRPLIGLTATIASLMAVSAANAFPATAPSAGATSSNIVKVYDRDDRQYHGRHYRRDRNVVHAPFTRVRSGRRTVVDAPFAHVYSDRHGRTHVRAPFVNYWD